MNKKELEFLISQGEGYNLEFKESFSNSIAKDICAFVNANGGKILLGVSDDSKTKGIKITNKLKSQIYDMAKNLEPKIEISLEKAESVIIIKIPEGINKPYSINGKFYLRYGPNSQQLRREEIREFFQKEGVILFDEKINWDFSLKKDFNKEAYQNFLKEAKISSILSRKEVLTNLSLLRDGFLKNAAVLLFCKKISKFFLNATITCVLFRGKTKYKILDRKEFDNNLYLNYTNAMEYLQSHLNTEYIIKGGPREEKLELPEEALREAILNAIAHRSYFSNANIQVYIFSDRVEIVNPGGLVKGITKRDLGKKSLSRNNLLFGLIQRMGLVEKVGTGILRMKRAMKECGLNGPRFEIDENWFTIIFIRRQIEKEIATQKTTQKIDSEFKELGEKLGEKLGENPIKIIYFIKRDKFITIAKLADKLNISTTAVEKNIKKLNSLNIIKRIGPDKGGYWKIVER